MIITIDQLEQSLKENNGKTVKIVPVKKGGAKGVKKINGVDLMAKTQKKLYEQAIKKMTNDIENKENFKKALIHEYLFRSSQSHLKKQQKEEADILMYNILGDSEDKLSNNDKKIFYSIVENNKVKKGGAKGDIVMKKKDFVEEHKNLISLLDKVGKEGKKQKKELKSKVGGAEDLIKQLVKLAKQHKNCRKCKMIKAKKGGKLNDCPAGWTEYPLTCTDWKSFPAKTVGRVDIDATNKEIEDAFKKAGDEILDLANKTKDFFEDVGRDVLKVFNIPEELWRSTVWDPLNKLVKDTILNEDWWKKTMSDPKTYICLVSYALMAATYMGCGPACMYVGVNLNNIGNMVVDLARGENPSNEQIANLFMGLIPAGGFYANEEEAAKSAFFSMKVLAGEIEGMSDARRAALIAKNLYDAGQGVKKGIEAGIEMGKDANTEGDKISNKTGQTPSGTRDEQGVIDTNDPNVAPTADQQQQQQKRTEDLQGYIKEVKNYSDQLNKLFDAGLPAYEYKTRTEALLPSIMDTLKSFKKLGVKYMITTELRLKDTELKAKILADYKAQGSGRKSKKY